MTPRTRWQGWTIVEKDGKLVLQDLVPVLLPSKAQADRQKFADEKVVRCELRLIK